MRSGSGNQLSHDICVFGLGLTFHRHTYPGYVKFHKHHGQGRQDEKSQKQLLESDIVFTTYATVAAELRGGRGVLRCVRWFRIVLDEGLTYDAPIAC